MKCFFCKGELETKTAAFMVELGKCIVVIKDVPAQVCSQCGEVSYNSEVAGQIEEIVDSMKPFTEIAIVHYPERAA